jgi:hypothetical protein
LLEAARRAQAQAARDDAQSDNVRRRVTRPGQPRRPDPRRRAKRISLRQVREAAAAAAATAATPPAIPANPSTTLGPGPLPKPTAKEGIVPFSNGFVHTILHAWEQDLHLTLRPDDIWLCILTQFSFFVNARAEALRGFFLTHQGKQNVTVMVEESLDKLDIPDVAQAQVQMLRTEMVDEGMVE